MDLAVVELARDCSREALRELPRRWAHVQGVAKTAEACATLVDPEKAPYVVAAAWLHDIGYAEPINITGFHPLDGSKFAQEHAFPPLVVSLIAYHTGALVEADERGLAPQLAKIAEPPESILDILTFADLTTSPTGEPVDPEARIEEILSRYEKSDPVHRAVTKSAPSLLAAVKRVEQRRTQPSNPVP